MEVNFGTVTGTPKPLSLKTANAVYVGQIILSDGSSSRAYIKRISPDKIAIEYAIAELTNQCGLSTPKPVITNWHGDVVFASVDANTPSLFSLAKMGDEQTILRAINNTETINKVASFDEVISNPDRNQQNILIKGDGDVILIDHECALSSEKDRPTDKNQFIEMLKVNIHPGDQLNMHRAFKEIEKYITAFECISTPDVANLLYSVNILTHKQRDLFIEYIDFRVANLTQLLKQQMGITSQIGLNFSA